MSGFEVTFSPDSKDITGWPEVTQLFGNKELVDTVESVEFNIGGVTNEITQIEYCIDKKNRPEDNVHIDFEGFRFTLSSGEKVTLEA